MKERYTLRCAVFLILTKIIDGKEHVLLQRRYNTGILDGKYDISCSGHLEKNETLTEALIREAKEELGIVIEKGDLKYISTMHAKFSDADYLLIAFSTDRYKGIPTIMEENKCDGLKWFDINNLPDNIIDTRKTMISDYINNNGYSEYGFK